MTENEAPGTSRSTLIELAVQCLNQRTIVVATERRGYGLMQF